MRNELESLRDEVEQLRAEVWALQKQLTEGDGLVKCRDLATFYLRDSRLLNRDAATLETYVAPTAEWLHNLLVEHVQELEQDNGRDR